MDTYGHIYIYICILPLYSAFGFSQGAQGWPQAQGPGPQAPGHCIYISIYIHMYPYASIYIYIYIYIYIFMQGLRCGALPRMGVCFHHKKINFSKQDATVPSLPRRDV